jgi:hypothetical protein
MRSRFVHEEKVILFASWWGRAQEPPHAKASKAPPNEMGCKQHAANLSEQSVMMTDPESSAITLFRSGEGSTTPNQGEKRVRKIEK